MKISTKLFYSLIALLTFLFLGKIELHAQLKDPEFIQLTQIAYISGDKDEAYQLLTILEKKYPDNGYILSERGGWQLYRENDINTALITLSKAIKLIPNHDVSLTLRGIAFNLKGFIEKAIEDQKAAIAINPEPIMYHLYLGRYQFTLAQYDEAITTFMIAIDMEPAAAEIYEDAFATYAKLNQPQAAKQLFEKGLLVGHMDIGFLRCYYGNFLMRLQQFDSAAKQYQMAYDMPDCLRS